MCKGTIKARGEYQGTTVDDDNAGHRTSQAKTTTFATTTTIVTITMMMIITPTTAITLIATIGLI